MGLTLLSAAALVFFPAMMALSASLDLVTMTIPNRLSAALAIGYLIVALASGAPLPVVLLNLSCGMAILTLTFAMFSFGWIGGGDAKLAAATALWMGWSLILDYGVAAAIYGGVLTVALLGARALPLPAALARYAWVARLHDRQTGVPYGIALAAAGMMIYPHSQIWAAAAA